MPMDKPKTYTVKAGKPAPFQRPGVDLDRHGRKWDTVLAKDLQDGDVIKDRGLVKTVWPFTDPDYEVDEIHVVLFNDEVDNYEPDQEIEAFVKRDDATSGR
jgi:hypothetical protein